MNKLNYKFIQDYNIAEDERGGFQLVLDGKNTVELFDGGDVLLESSMKDGVYPMLVGWCGMFPCCGTFIKVRNESDRVVWEKFYHEEGADQDESEISHEIGSLAVVGGGTIKAPLVFDRKEYCRIGRELAKKAEKLLVGGK